MSNNLLSGSPVVRNHVSPIENQDPNNKITTSLENDINVIEIK